jgi:hypothetical protein
MSQPEGDAAGAVGEGAPERASAGDAGSSSSDEEEDEASKQLWAKVEGVLDEYHLSRFALAAAKRWVRLMGGTYANILPAAVGES